MNDGRERYLATVFGDSNVQTPDRHMSVVTAHLVVQQHRDCDRGRCPLKALAVQTLIEAGHMQHSSDYDRCDR